jgi:hypothetical protein
VRSVCLSTAPVKLFLNISDKLSSVVCAIYDHFPDGPKAATSALAAPVFSAILAPKFFPLRSEPSMQLFIPFRVQYDEHTVAGGSLESLALDG